MPYNNFISNALWKKKSYFLRRMFWRVQSGSNIQKWALLLNKSLLYSVKSSSRYKFFRQAFSKLLILTTVTPKKFLI